MSAGRFSGFCNFFASNLTCEISAPMGARHKNFGPKCSVASPPTNGPLIFLKKFKGERGDKLKWGTPKNEKIDFRFEKHLDAVIIFLK